MWMTKKQVGFTLIELIIVVAILGVISVIALPRFIDISSDAEISTAKSASAAFQSGIELAHYHWVLTYNGNAVTRVDGILDDNVNFNQSGFIVDAGDYQHPSGTTNLTLNDNRCGRVWNAVLNYSPSLHPSGAGTKRGNGSTRYYTSNEDGTFIVSSSSQNTCTYALLSDSQVTIEYDASEGNVFYRVN